MRKLSADMLDLNNANLIGKGSSRLCYEHPYDRNKCVKVTYIDAPEIIAKEMWHYRRLENRKTSWNQLARLYGLVETTMGTGAVFSLARDFDGTISTTLDSYLVDQDKTPPAKQLSALLQDFRGYMLRECVVVRELKADNLVYQRLSPDNGRLVLIDGIGNNQFLPFANYIDVFARQLIRRKWRKFERHLIEIFPDNRGLQKTLKLFYANK